MLIVQGVNMVINYDFPPSAVEYIHRIGNWEITLALLSLCKTFVWMDVISLLTRQGVRDVLVAADTLLPFSRNQTRPPCEGKTAVLCHAHDAQHCKCHAQFRLWCPWLDARHSPEVRDRYNGFMWMIFSLAYLFSDSPGRKFVRVSFRVMGLQRRWKPGERTRSETRNEGMVLPLLLLHKIDFLLFRIEAKAKAKSSWTSWYLSVESLSTTINYFEWVAAQKKKRKSRKYNYPIPDSKLKHNRHFYSLSPQLCSSW